MKRRSRQDAELAVAIAAPDSAAMNSAVTLPLHKYTVQTNNRAVEADADPTDADAEASAVASFGAATAGQSDLAPVRSALHRQFICFCENTTIRGIPRIIKSESRRIRLLWIFFVVALFVACILCLSFLTLQFIEYDVMHPPRVLKDYSSPFPSVTLCNMRPLSSEGRQQLSQQGWKYPRDFSESLELFARNLYFYNESTKYVYYNFSGSMGFPAYLESLPRSASRDIGHTLQDFILDCRAVIRNGSARNLKFCSPEYVWGGKGSDMFAGNFHAFLHGNYMNCYTLDLHEELRDNTTMVEMAVYLDNEWNLDNFNCVDCYTMDISTQLSGAVLTIHSGDTYPDVNHEAIHLKAGSLTEVKLKHVLNVQKQAPYGRCSQDTQRNLNLFGREYKYSEDACRQATIQRDILNTCGCQAIEYPLVRESNFTYCTGLEEFLRSDGCNWATAENDQKRLADCSATLQKVYGYIRCKNDVISKYSKDVVESCTLPCSFYSYQTERSTSDWPTRSFQLRLLNSRVYSRLLNRKEMKAYRKAIEKLNNNGSIQEAYEMLKHENLLERNLLSIQLIRPNFDLHKVEEKEVLSLTSFLSQIGGLFSIFVGLTMISVVELIDFFIHCYEICTRQSRGVGRASAVRRCDGAASRSEADVLLPAVAAGPRPHQKLPNADS
ncbi:hypothetical protein BOX15_Mlig031432g1 [Macrostomum lignano]|uniref:FMRFamide-activated amiloride-sensitive sodium channel n=1 Tax=Macrostomum lignano TaxID=282301 RepID=A0A267F3Z0_9PLAT|nr:hypothetical protein BOX15_Mlig031432g1 [Macrostomum lignano]